MYEFGSQPEIIKEITLPQGMEIDVSEAWRKLISSQFGGSPGRGFGELIQNFLDSYPASTPWRDRKGEIQATNNEIILDDYGEGMNQGRLKLLLTLGGTDKKNDIEKIGTFGVGFFSIFNPRLGTEKVVVTTRCEDHVVKLMFNVHEHGKRPDISAHIVGEPVSFSTRVHVTFSDPSSSKQCLKYARECLQYYPCKMTINGEHFQSVWEIAEQKGFRIFKNGNCDGLIDVKSSGGYAKVLCKYEHIINLSIQQLVVSGRLRKHDLRDYKIKSMPCLEQEKTIINSNTLNVTISRDSFKMDHAYREMVEVLKQEMLEELLGVLKEGDYSPHLILANQYIFSHHLGTIIRSSRKSPVESDNKGEFLTILLEAKVYSIKGRLGNFSLLDLYIMLSKGLPLFFSPDKQNLNWLNGAFRHDYIVLPPPMRFFKHGAPNFYGTIFQAVFKDCVNLDTIKDNGEKIRELVQRNIVPEALLEPDLKIAGERELSREEQQLVAELGQLFSLDGVRATICDELHANFDNVHVAFFEFHDQGAVIATGLFDEEGNVLKSGDYLVEKSGFQSEEDDVKNQNQSNTTVLLGLNRNSILIKNLLETNNADRSLFMLPVLANELVLSQKWLTPYSESFNQTSDNLAKGMRDALLTSMLQ